MTPLVIVPARMGSKGVQNKNFRLLPDGTTLTERACMMGLAFGQVVLTTDAEGWAVAGCHLHKRPAELATDDATMADVVRDVLQAYAGPEDQPILLLQPTTPFRTREVVQGCLNLLTKHCDSVASAYAVPPAFLPDRVLISRNGIFQPADRSHNAANRQQARPAYVRDGQCYAFTRSAADYWDFDFFRALVTVDAPALNIDTETQWEEARRIVRAEMAQ